MHGNDQLVGVDDGQPVRVLEPKPRGRMRPAGISKPALCRGPLAEVVGPQGDGPQLVGVVNDKDAERILVFMVGKPHAGRPYGGGEAQVQDERRIGLFLAFADVGDADAQDGAVVEHPPEERPRRAVVFAVVDGRGGGEALGTVGALVVGRGGAPAGARPSVGVVRRDPELDGRRLRRGLKVEARLLVQDLEVAGRHLGPRGLRCGGGN